MPKKEFPSRSHLGKGRELKRLYLTFLFIQCNMDAEEVRNENLAKALAKCLHSPLIGQALQFGLLFVQKTYTRVCFLVHIQ